MRLRVQRCFRFYCLFVMTVIAVITTQVFGDLYGSFLVVNPAFAQSGAAKNKIYFASEVVPPKRMPNNAATPIYTEAMAASDAHLAPIFGGPGGVAAANGFEPRSLGRPYPIYRGDLIDDDGKIRRGHL